MQCACRKNVNCWGITLCFYEMLKSLTKIYCHLKTKVENSLGVRTTDLLSK